jgi:hypothetical protein
MDFTFGIITDGKNDKLLLKMIHSIHMNNIPNYEIIIVGNTNLPISKNITIILFDETINPGWITRKKNIITSVAKYENVVLLHDYIQLNPDWYSGFLRFGNDFDWCVTRILNMKNRRFRDYTLLPSRCEEIGLFYSPGDIDPYFFDNCLLPYDFENSHATNKYMYISGSYYIIKKSIALRFPLDETLFHCQSEDVELSKRLHQNGIIIRCNPFSSVSFLKPKGSVHWEKEICPEKLREFIEYCNDTSSQNT